MNWAARSAAGRTVSGWMPLLKRTLASLGRLNCFIVRRMLTKSKLADSSRIFVVLLGDFGFRPAHDARQRDRSSRVGDDDVFRRQGAFLAVQRDECFTGACRAHDDGRRLPAGALDQNVVIEGVQRLAPFEHDVVGDVDDVVDGPHAGVG